MTILSGIEYAATGLHVLAFVKGFLILLPIP
jgi:hypothetical protein